MQIAAAASHYFRRRVAAAPCRVLTAAARGGSLPARDARRSFASSSGSGGKGSSDVASDADDRRRRDVVAAQMEQQRDALENIISVDRSTLREQISYARDDDAAFEALTPLARELRSSILTRGPLTVAEFMRQCLTHDKHGYYIQGDVFGTKGDFTTSPEISQVFGELLGVWCVSMWQQLGEPPAIQLVELGPGRGTLMADMVRAARKFPAFAAALSCHLVEVSPALREVQRESVCGPTTSSPSVAAAATLAATSTAVHDEATGHLASCTAADGLAVSWHGSFADVPHTPGVPCLVVGQEFLDALPVHQFQKTELGWCERLVDLAPPPAEGEWSDDGAGASSSASSSLPGASVSDGDGDGNDDGDAGGNEKRAWFRLVNSPGKTPATVAYIRDHFGAAEVGDTLEVCPAACAVVQDVALRLQRAGGGALFVDYGPGANEGPPGESVRGISRHGFLSFLRQPGAVDVTADVDFAALRRAVEQLPSAAPTTTATAAAATVPLRAARPELQAFGPVTQGTFLFQMGIEARMQQLLEAADGQRDDQIQIFEGVQRLVDPGGMGGLYKAMALRCLPPHAESSGGGAGGAEEPPLGFAT